MTMMRLSAFLALRQLRHRGRGSIGGLAGVCVAIILMFMQLGFQNALYDSAINIPKALRADLLITGPNYLSLALSPPWFPRRALAAARSIDGVEDARPLYAFSGQFYSPRNGATMSAWVLAFDLDQPVFSSEEITQKLSLLKLPDSALMDRKSRYDYTVLKDAIETGSSPRITLYQPNASNAPGVTLNGLFSLGPSFTIDGLLMMGSLNYYRLLGMPLDRVSIGLVTMKSGADPLRVKAQLTAAVGDQAKVFTRSEYIAAEKDFYATRTPIGAIFNIGLLVGVVVGVVFISQVLHGIIDANLREYAVLITMGYQNRFFTMIVIEIAVAISIATFIPSALIAAGLYHLASLATQLPLTMSAGGVATIFIVVLVMGNIAALMSMKKLKTANPLDLFS